jgi:hypothetical protein
MAVFGNELSLKLREIKYGFDCLGQKVVEPLSKQQ